MNTLKLPTLLVITDNPSVRFWIKKHLDEDFFIVDAAKKHTALAAAQTTSFDFVVIDSELEDCDPVELAAELKQILLTLTPILLITGRLKRSYLDAAKKAGVTDFLNHQLDLEEFQAKIESIRKGYSLREKTQEASSVMAKTRKAASGDDLKNRVQLQTQVMKEIENAKKEGVPIAALILSIDRFKELLNQFGPSMAEEIVIPFTNLLSPFLSKESRLIPSSEGRFIILLKNFSPEEGRNLAEKIKKEISKKPFQTKSGPIPVTASIAVSSLERDFNLQLDSSLKALKKAQDLIISIEPETP
jgi:diguanylate cyclase (GGDEF)-like protein